MENQNESSEITTELTYYFIDRVKIGLQVQNIEMTKELNAQIEMYLRSSHNSVKKELGDEFEAFIKKCAMALVVYFNKEMDREGDPQKRLEIHSNAIEIFRRVLLMNVVLVENIDDVLSDQALKKLDIGFQPVYVYVAIQWYRNVNKALRKVSNTGCVILFALALLFLMFGGIAVTALLK